MTVHAFPRPIGSTNFATANRSDTRDCQPIQEACHRRSKLAGTTPHPSRSVRYFHAAALLRPCNDRPCRYRLAGVPSLRTASVHRTRRKRAIRFRLAMLSNQIHAVIPITAAHQWQTVCTKTEAVVNRSKSVIVNRTDVVGSARQVVIRLFVRMQCPRIQERGRARPTNRCRRSYARSAECQWQPEEIIGKVGSHSASEGWVPPMLHVPLREIAATRRAAGALSVS